MIVTVTLNPCIDHTAFVNGLRPHDSNKVTRVESDIGGKGVNVSRIVQELGGKTVATGFLGGGTGAMVRRFLDSNGVPNQFVKIDGDTRTNWSVESGDGPPTVFSSPGPEVTGLEWESLLAAVGKLALGSAWVVFGGSLPPGMPEAAYEMLVSLAKAQGSRVVLDADGDALRSGLRASPDFLKPNLDEASRLLGHPVSDSAAAARSLRESTGADVVVLSMGSRGSVLACGEGVFQSPAVPVDAKSTIGSGDSMIGAMLWAKAQGMPWSEALSWGTAAGAATAMTDGTEIGRREDIVRLQKLVQVNPA